MNPTRLPSITPVLPPLRPGQSHYRYTILGLLFFASVINYIDRQIIGLLKPTLEKQFHWSEQDYATIVFWFQALYAIGYLLAGRFVDRVGAKVGYGVAVLFWSLASIAHGFVGSTFGFTAVRGALGFAEAGSFPSAIKSIAEWFPAKERSLATGIMVSGNTIGPIMAPFLVLWLATRYSWQASFIITGALGLLWVLAWYFLYSRPQNQARLSASELAYIEEGQDQTEGEAAVPLSRLLRLKATWGFAWATFLTDPVWWFYLFWLPSYLTSQGMSKTEIVWPLSVVYAETATLSIAGGWLSSLFLRWGWTLNRSRKTTLIICVLLAFQVVLIRYSSGIWMSVGIIALAAAAHTVWKSILLTSVADQFPRRVVSSVAGVGGFCGAIGGMLVAKGVGILLDHYKADGQLNSGYNLIFACCGCAYVLGLIGFHFLSPRLQKVVI